LLLSDYDSVIVGEIKLSSLDARNESVMQKENCAEGKG
jgi:hypothetical protein